MRDAAARALHRDSIVIDGLNASYFAAPGVLARLQAGGITAVNATIAAWHDLPATMAIIAEMHRLLRQQHAQVMQVMTADDIVAAKQSGRVGLIFGFQDTSPIGDNLGLLSVYRMLGVRIIQLTYNHRNLVGAGCLEPTDEGLTEFGRQVVAEMNRLGILIDLSHCGPRTTWEAIESSQQPVAITHANPFVRCPNPRNKEDAVFKAVAAKGGVVGAVVFPPLLTGRPQATLDDYLDTLDYLVALVGVDHVGLGPDFMEEMPAEVAAQALRGMPSGVLQQFMTVQPTVGFASIAACANVTVGLLQRGYSVEAIQKIIGGNWLRLYRSVW